MKTDSSGETYYMAIDEMGVTDRWGGAQLERIKTEYCSMLLSWRKEQSLTSYLGKKTQNELID